MVYLHTPKELTKTMGLVWVIGWVLGMFLIVIKSFIHFQEGHEKSLHQLGLKSSTLNGKNILNPRSTIK